MHLREKGFTCRCFGLYTWFVDDKALDMMGHTISTYNDVKMKGVEFLRNLYAQSGLTIRPRTKLSKIDQLKLIIEAWGMNPNEILSKEAISRPNRTILDSEESQITVLNQALKQAIIKEVHQDVDKG